MFKVVTVKRKVSENTESLKRVASEVQNGSNCCFAKISPGLLPRVPSETENSCAIQNNSTSKNDTKKLRSQSSQTDLIVDVPSAKKTYTVSREVQTGDSRLEILESLTTVPFDWNSIGKLNWGNLYSKVLSDPFETYRLCFTVKLIPTNVNCKDCGSRCKLYHKYKCGKIPRLNFICWKCKARNIRKFRSVFIGTIFENARVSPAQILGLAYWFVYGSGKFEEAVRECEFNTSLRCLTVSAYYNYFREVCCSKARDSTFIGGPGCTVEVNEFAKMKCAREPSKQTASAYVIIGVCKESGEAFIMENKERTVENFLRIIIQFVQPYTTIVTNCSRFFEKLTEKKWETMTAGSCLNFRDSKLVTDFQTTCGIWASLKTSLMSKRCSDLDKVLGTYMWKRKYSKMNMNLYKLLLQHVAEAQQSKAKVPRYQV